MDVGFGSPTINVGMLLILGQKLPPSVNKRALVNDVKAPKLDVPNGGRPDLGIFYQKEKVDSLDMVWT